MFISSSCPHMGFPTAGLFTFFSYDPRCLYPETYPELSTMSSRPALPFPRPAGSKRSLWDPVNLEVSVRRLTVGEATALCEDDFQDIRVYSVTAGTTSAMFIISALP